MSTEFATEPAPKKDNRNIIYGILIAALLGTWGYIIYDKSKTGSQVANLTTQNADITTERDEIKDLYGSSLARLDSLMGENQNITDSLGGQNSEIARLRGEITRVLSNKNATSADLAKARRMISDLNGRIEGLAAEVERLTGENQSLTSNNVRLTEEKMQVEESLATTAQRRDSIQKSLTETVDVGSTLSASNINLTPLQVKNSGKEKETTTAKRVDKMRISFILNENRVATSGDKQLYISVTGPDGNPISDSKSGSGMFQTRDNGEYFYTNRVNVNYDNNKKVPVSFDWSNGKDFETGNYKIEVFHNGYKIGESVRTLKKGGIFG